MRRLVKSQSIFIIMTNSVYSNKIKKNCLNNRDVINSVTIMKHSFFNTIETQKNFFNSSETAKFLNINKKTIMNQQVPLQKSGKRLNTSYC